MLARELGSKIYDRYVTQRKLRSRQLEKVQEVYGRYMHLLAKDSQVGAARRGSRASGSWSRGGARQFACHLLTSARSGFCKPAALQDRTGGEKGANSPDLGRSFPELSVQICSLGGGIKQEEGLCSASPGL